MNLRILELLRSNPDCKDLSDELVLTAMEVDYQLAGRLIDPQINDSQLAYAQNKLKKIIVDLQNRKLKGIAELLP